MIPYETKWRLFIGDDPDVVLTEEIYPIHPGDGWSQARIELAKAMEEFLTDECWDCRLSGVAAFNRLAALEYQQEFEAEIDGNYYRLTRVAGE